MTPGGCMAHVDGDPLVAALLVIGAVVMLLAVDFRKPGCRSRWFAAYRRRE
jgi:hypothetical protein